MRPPAPEESLLDGITSSYSNEQDIGWNSSWDEAEELYHQFETGRHNWQTKRRKALYKSLVDGSLTEKDAYKVGKEDEIWLSAYRRYA